MSHEYNGKFYDKVIIWGAGRVLYRYESLLGNIDYIVDSSSSLQGQIVFGKKIYAPKLISEEMGDLLIVVAATAFIEEITDSALALNPMADVESIVDVFGNNHLFFGQYREDAIIELLLRKHNRGKIRYLEIGSMNPIGGSNTYHFYLNGHSGVCVEANPDVIDELRRKRPMDVILHNGCGSREDEGKKLAFHIVKDRPGASTFSEEFITKLKEKGFECEKTIEVQMLSLNTIVREYFYENKTPLDYISIDVEGYEYAILKDFDFDNYPVSVFCIEKGDDEVKALMVRKGYKRVAETPANWIFVREELAGDMALLLEKEL